mgnify:CR=1 FL=1
MKTILVGMLILCTGCVSIETYEADIQKLQIERDKFKQENLWLRVDLEMAKGFNKQCGEYTKELESKLKELQPTSNAQGK